MCFTLLTFLLPLQLLRGDYGGLPNATERAEQILGRAPRPARESSAIIKGARQCCAYERPVATAPRHPPQRSARTCATSAAVASIASLAARRRLIP